MNLPSGQTSEDKIIQPLAVVFNVKIKCLCHDMSLCDVCFVGECVNSGMVE